MTMKALVLVKNSKLKLMDLPMPEKFTEDSYLIKISYAGICGSDIHRGFEKGAYHYPLIMGHEFSGVIEKSFKDAKYREGQRVTVFPLLPCYKCKACQTGDYAQCSNYDYFGSRRNGAFAEYLYVPGKNIFPVPDHVELIHAAMTEPCAVALHGVRKFNLKGGERAVVFGSGPIGNMAAQWLKLKGSKKVIVIDIDEKKLNIAEKMGFIPCNSKKTDPVEYILENTDGEGADVSIEACGLPITYRQAINSTARFGEVVFLGNIAGDFILPQKEVSDMLRKELKVYGTWNSKIVPTGIDDWSTVLKFMDKEIHVQDLISHIFPLEEGINAFKYIINKEGFYNKIIFKIGA